MQEFTGARWLLLIHQIPPKPSYLRVKIWRRLQRLGAVAIKNSVYALPQSEQKREDFQWVLREIVEGGGDGTICDAQLVDGMTDDQVEGLFQSAREADYTEIVRAAHRLAKTMARKAGVDQARRAQLEHHVARLRRRFDEVVAIDFFGSPSREAASGLIAGIESRLHGKKERSRDAKSRTVLEKTLQSKTWVTRKDVHVDRIASAWLIRRFIDRDAQFKFVPAKGYKPLQGEIRFDMFEAEFTHEGDRCTMEVLIQRLALDDPAITRIAEIVHDIDLKDAKFGHAETLGIERLIAGITMSHKVDETRFERGAGVFDDLYGYFASARG